MEAAIDHRAGSHILKPTAVVGMIVAPGGMIASERRPPMDLRPPEREQGRFPLGSGSSTGEMRLSSQLARKLQKGPGELFVVRIWRLAISWYTVHVTYDLLADVPTATR